MGEQVLGDHRCKPAQAFCAGPLAGLPLLSLLAPCLWSPPSPGACPRPHRPLLRPRDQLGGLGALLPWGVKFKCELDFKTHSAGTTGQQTLC